MDWVLSIFSSLTLYKFDVSTVVGWNSIFLPVTAIMVWFYLFHDGGPYHVETSPLICYTNQWIGFYMMGTSFMKELKCFPYSVIASDFPILSVVFKKSFFESFLTGTKKTWSKVNKCFNTGILINLQSHYLLILVINAADTQFSIENEWGENDWVENVWKFVTLGPSWKIVLKYESALITESQKESFI